MTEMERWGGWINAGVEADFARLEKTVESIAVATYLLATGRPPQRRDMSRTRQSDSHSLALPVCSRCSFAHAMLVDLCRRCGGSVPACSNIVVRIVDTCSLRVGPDDP